MRDYVSDTGASWKEVRGVKTPNSGIGMVALDLDVLCLVRKTYLSDRNER